MRFLIDNALSPQLAEILRASGHDAAHVCEMGMGDAPDLAIFERAASDGRTIVSADTDFGTLLALRNASAPSVILFRGGTPRRPGTVAALLLANLDRLAPILAAGAVVVFDEDRTRVRALPIGAGT
jgi:predicted nuclease of predicted toxin-antitoxin system